MRRNSLPMLEESFTNVPELLRTHGLTVETHRDLNEFKLLRCTRGDVGVLLAVSKPAHWATAADQRREMVVVAVMGESLFRFWRLARENRLCRDVFELLRPLQWSAEGSDAVPGD
jgi:hypothetical protein